MANTHSSPKSKPRRYSTANGFTTMRGVRQDKSASKRARAASPQPAPRKKVTRSRQMDTNISRSQKYSKKHSQKRQMVQITIWLKPSVKAEIQRIAAKEGLSVSQTGRAALEEWVRQQLHIQHAVLLQPIIETAIRKEISRNIARLVLVQARNAYETGWTRRLASNILKYSPGMTEEKLNIILDRSSSDARKNIFRKTPQIDEVSQAIRKTLEGEEEK